MLALCGLASWSAPRTALASGPVLELRAQLEAIRGQLEDLSQQFETRAFEASEINLMSRWVDAKVFFDTGEIARAALILSTLVDEPSFRSSGNYPEALYILGQSLYLQQNHEGARRAFERLFALEVPEGLRQRALYYLTDSALRLQRYDEIDAAFARWGGATLTPELLYIRGKASWFRGDLARARASLAAIPKGSAPFPQARYYLGVVYTARGELDQARAAFSDVVAALKPSPREAPEPADGPEPTRPPQSTAQRAPAPTPSAELRALANLALGRLAVERGDWLEAVESYQAVPRGSAHYPRSVYELAWAYINAGRIREGLQAFDVISLVGADPRLVLQASMDRSRLQIQMKQYADAQESFEALLRRFIPVKNELDRFARSDKNLELYFNWLIHRYDKKYALELPLSERAARWIETGAGLDDIIRVFDEVAVQHKEVEDLETLATDLRTALTGTDRVALFPGLGDAWIRLLALENRLIHFKRQVLDLQARRRRERTGTAEPESLAEARRRARALEARFGTLPTTPSAYRVRLREMAHHYGQLQREAFEVSRALAELREELRAVDRFIKELEFAADQEDPRRATAQDLRESLDREKRRMTRMAAELTAVEQSLKTELARVGLGGDTVRNEEELKAALLEIYRSLEMAYIGSGGSKELAQLHAAAWEALARIGRIRERIHVELDRASAKLLAVVDSESKKIVGYRGRVGGLDHTSQALARDVGHALFKAANARIRATVLDADLGVIDLAWERKQEVTDRMARLKTERSSKVKEVQAILKEMLEGPSYKPMKSEDEPEPEPDPPLDDPTEEPDEPGPPAGAPEKAPEAAPDREAAPDGHREPEVRP